MTDYAPVHVESLTPRENEVLEHIVLGKSNPEIADVLIISVHTVDRHVSTILGKLGVSTRTQAAVVAVRTGMVNFQDA